jgi:hypothetical protein
MTTSRLQKVSMVKEENKRKISTYLNDPDNEWMNRTSLGVTICGYKDQRSLYRHFSPEELTEIENESLEERKRRSAGKRAVIYDAMFLKAKMGDVAAMKEYLDRTEGKVPNKVDANLQHYGKLDQELPDYILEMM